jgi:actin-related protein
MMDVCRHMHTHLTSHARVHAGVYAPSQPANTAWEGMSAFVAGGEYAEVAMTKAEYEETGGSASRMRDARS